MIKKIGKIFRKKDISAPAVRPVGPIETRIQEKKAKIQISPEQICGLENPEAMDKAEIKSHLAGLYRRYNQAVSSLNAEQRIEAEEMLEAIAECREKWVDAVGQ